MPDLFLSNLNSCFNGDKVQGRPFPLAGSQMHYARSKDFHTEHMKLELSFDFEKRRILGQVSITLSAMIDGLRRVELDGVELLVKGVAIEGKELEFDYSGRTIGIELGRELNAGEKVMFTVKYEASPRKGLYFIQPDEAYPSKPVQIWTQGEDEDSRYWYPCYDYPNDRSTSELIVTVPAKFTAVSNGKLLDVRENADGTRTFHWREEVAHPSYLNSLVVREYVRVEDVYDGVPVEYYVAPGLETEARRSFGKTPAMIRFFSEKLGVKYPYEKYAQTTVTDFTFGGMENISATTQTELTLHDERAHLDFTSDGLVAHELAHQWFGDLLTCRDWSHGWLNEGFATYFDKLFMEEDKGHDEFLYEMMQVAARYRDEDAERYRRPIVEKLYETPSELFDRHLYEKGACVLHMLRFVLGERLFWKSLAHYTQEHQRQNVETDDLRRAIEEATGRNLEDFFSEWLYKAGHPEFKVRYQWKEDTKTAELTVNQNQSSTDDTPIFHVPVEIKFTSNKGAESFRVDVREKEETFYFPLTAKPKTVEFDPGDWILKTLDFEKPRELLLNQLSSKNVVERIRGVQGLGRLGSKADVEAIEGVLLGDAFWGVQAEAAKTLSSIRSDEALKVLVKGLEVKHPKARRAVVRALGEFRKAEAAEALIPVLKQDESYFVEAEAAASLGKTRSLKAFEPLKEALGKESFNDVIRQGVFQGFGELRDERAISIAVDWSRYGKPPQTRAAAVGALGKLGDLKKDQVYDHLVSLIPEWEFRVVIQAVQALQTLKDPKAIPELEKLSQQTINNGVRRRAKEAVKALQEGLERSKEFQQLREDVDKMREENRSLRSKLEEIESQLKARKPAKRLK
jgi:aminopeptidase N